MRFSEYEAWLAAEVANTPLEPGCEQIGPFLTPTVVPDKPPWQMEWTVLFADGYYFRVVENWFRRSSSLGGHGCRRAFSFHYGPTNPAKDDNGVPLPSNQFPATIRVDQDVDWRGPHLHYNGEDHVRQSRVQDLRISDMEPFQFIKAVMEHRRTRQDFDRIMQFAVTK